MAENKENVFSKTFVRITLAGKITISKKKNRQSSEVSIEVNMYNWKTGIKQCSRILILAFLLL